MNYLIEYYLITKDHQFEVKKNNSAAFCLFIVKHKLKFYNLYDTLVYSCFQNVSKACDQISHWTLSRKR